MPSQLQLVVLHTLKFRDSSIIINGYSNHFGRQSYILYSGKSSKNYAALSQLHPLSIIDIELNGSSKGELKVIKEYCSAFKLSSLRTDLTKNAIAIFISELIYRCIKEVEQNDDLYNFLVGSILKLENLSENKSNFHLCFVVDLCKHLGYYPDNNYTSTLNIFDIKNAKFCTQPESFDYSFCDTNSLILSEILINDPSRINILNISGAHRYNFVKDMIKFMCYHLGFEVNIRSLNVLHEVFE